MKKHASFIPLLAVLLCLAACGPAAGVPVENPTADLTSRGEPSSFGIPTIPPPAGTTAGSGAQGGAQNGAPEPSTKFIDVVSVVIPEGFTFYQIARRLEASGVCSAVQFTNAAQAYQVQSFAVPASPRACYRLEGMLYPDTYDFYLGETPESVLRKFLNNYAEKSGLPDYNLLILASIIERETRSSEHMAMVSSVFHNRLARGMRLQADATIAYAQEHINANPLVQNPGQYADLYNTYKCPALPEGPICSPSRRAIDAARNPSASDYLYYFFGRDNTNHYTKSYEEHLAAIKIYGLG